MGTAARPARLAANIAKAYLFQFLQSLNFIAGILVPFFTQWGGITFAQTMLLQSWFVAWVFLLEVPTGAVADHFGRKTSLLLGAGILIAGVLVYVSRPDFRVFLIGEFLWAVATAFISGADQALVYDSLVESGQEGRSKAVLARLASFHIGGIMVGAPLGSLMAARWGLRLPVALMAVPFALAVLVAWTFEEPPIYRRPAGDYLGNLVGGVRFFTRHKVLLAMAMDSVTIGVLSFMSIWLSQPYLLSLGLPMASLGAVLSAVTGAQILVSSQFDRLERLAGGKKRYLAFSAVLAGLCYLLLPFAPGPWTAAALFVILGGAGLSRSTLIANYMNKHIPSAQRATVLSSVSMLRKLLAALLYPVAGFCAEYSLRATLALLGAAALASAVSSQVREEHLPD